MAIHGLSDESFEFVKKMIGKDVNTPFKLEFHVYRFAAMLGLILNKRTSGSATWIGKWNSSTITGNGEYNFEDIFSILGAGRDYVDWVRAMDEYADGGIKYIENWYGSDGKYNVTGLVRILSEKDLVECVLCGFYDSHENIKCDRCGEIRDG